MAIQSVETIGAVIVPAIAGGTITKGRFITGIRTSATVASADTDKAWGVALDNAVSGETFRVAIAGVVKMEAGGAITGPATVHSDSSGRAVANSGTGLVLGIALGNASAAGDAVEVLLSYGGIEEVPEEEPGE